MAAPPVAPVLAPSAPARFRATGPLGRWARRAVALFVTALGVVDLALAASQDRGVRGWFVRPDYSPGVEVGGRYLLLFAGLGCLMTVRPLLAGRRTAWWVGVAAVTASLAGHHLRSGGRHGIALALATLSLLAVARPMFVARIDPRLQRHGWWLLLGGELATLAYAVTGLYLLDPAFRRPLGVREALGDGVRLLFLLPSSAEPVTPHGEFFVESVRVAALAVALVGIGRLLATVTGTPGQQRDRRAVRELLEAHATTSLAHFQLLDDKAWVFSPDRRAFVGYSVIGATAVALGDPIGAPSSRVAAAEAFLQQCALSGWTPAFQQVTPEGARDVRAVGMRLLTIGEEAVVDLASWSTEGHARKSLRSALRRVERAGHRVVALPHPVTDADLRRLREVSDLWLTAGHHRERTFALGRFDAAQLRETPIMAVVDGDGVVQAFANVLPHYHSPDRTFDLMRRRPGSMNGVMDLLFVALLERFRVEGAAGMSLGLAPFSGAGDPTVAGRITSQIYQRGGATFNFEGLRAFKDKWGPRWEPRYLAYAAELDLPKVALAAARVGELPDPRTSPARALAVVRRYPVTTAMLGLQLWLSVIGTLHPAVHAQLQSQFGLAWEDLGRLELWRLFTSPLIPPHPGFEWGNLSLAAFTLPLAEWRLGAGRTVSWFFAGDLLSTLPVLLISRIAAAGGSTAAADVIRMHDSGLSSGCCALLVVGALTLAPRWRHLALGAVFGVLVGMALILRALDTSQHLLTAVAVLVVCAVRASRVRRQGFSKPASISSAAPSAEST